MQEDVPEYHYTVESLAPSRLGHRWRWQLFRGDRLVAGGWHLGERRALLALRTAASRAAHERLGLRAVHDQVQALPGHQIDFSAAIFSSR